MFQILIVDDDMATVAAIKESLDWQKLGITKVFTAYHVSAAKRIIEKNTIDIILSDIEMPKENGLDLLKWVRKKQFDIEFLLLTCHENFSYAADAIRYQVVGYMTKPFDQKMMTLTLQKLVKKLVQDRNRKKTSVYGLWMEKNIRFMKLDLWRKLLDGGFKNKQLLQQEIESRQLDIETNTSYRLIVTKMNHVEQDFERYGKSVYEFILEGFHSEIILNEIENEHVVLMNKTNNLTLVTITASDDEKELERRCEKLRETCQQYFKGSMTCCISKKDNIMNLGADLERIEQLFIQQIGLFGTVFREEMITTSVDTNPQIIELDKLVTFVEEKSKSQILNYLKIKFDELTSLNQLNNHVLYLMKQEIIQVVYSDLMNHGIQATRLFYDEISMKQADQAVESIIHFIRWVNYLLEKTFSYEDEISKTETIVDKINHFIYEHYSENISRNEVATEFYLTPSYLAKIYKKRTGKNIKDFINEYRIEKAKALLREGKSNISDISEQVGFENFSYFSTVFKKIVGKSPKEYKNLFEKGSFDFY